MPRDCTMQFSDLISLGEILKQLPNFMPDAVAGADIIHWAASMGANLSDNGLNNGYFPYTKYKINQGLPILAALV